tara:strand:+ start:1013 stop:1585 length:573 start_codon:yes stop_codon:yes gene_type:complete
MTPEENISLQQEWCDCASPAIQKGARDAVIETVLKLSELGIPIGKVLEIGPQYGFGLDEWKKHSEEVLGVDIVPEFIESCHGLGLNCLNCPAEEIDDHVDGKWNFYMRDSAEHFIDKELVFSKILPMTDKWIYLSVPVEPDEPRDKAHLSKFNSIEEARSLFNGMTMVFERLREPTEAINGRYLGIWIKD